ncbi:hypothetical protein [Pseudoxanthomonas kalamensis]|uniref:hypothetical protein n=1 Tax=Pseudoxanthomonas kalamensis TaxID=289483 RepID=UPI00139094DE|nr:hypothetical protein [Pseudoxanthomonas kalamensis]
MAESAIEDGTNKEGKKDAGDEGKRQREAEAERHDDGADGTASCSDKVEITGQHPDDGGELGDH